MLYKLESLRGIAALMVLIFHSNVSVFLEENKFIESAWLFVDFFFVLSGFIMSLAYIDKIKLGLSFKEYFYARFFRLFPLHVAVLLMVIPLIAFKYYYYYSGYGGTDPALTENITTFFTTFFLLNSLGFENGWNAPSWSISAEFVAYFAFYFVIVFCTKVKSLFTVSLLIAIATYSLSFYLFGVFVPLTWDFGFLRSIPGFFIGVALFIYYSKQSLTSYISSQEVLAVLFVVTFVSLTSINKFFAYAAIVSFVYCVYVFSAERSGFLGRILNRAFPRMLGRYSYSIYITHLLVITVAEDFLEHILGLPYKSIYGMKAVMINTCILLVVVTLSHFTFIMIEKPCRDFGKRFIEQRRDNPKRLSS